MILELKIWNGLTSLSGTTHVVFDWAWQPSGSKDWRCVVGLAECSGQRPWSYDWQRYDNACFDGGHQSRACLRPSCKAGRTSLDKFAANDRNRQRWWCDNHLRFWFFNHSSLISCVWPTAVAASQLNVCLENGKFQTCWQKMSMLQLWLSSWLGLLQNLRLELTCQWWCWPEPCNCSKAFFSFSDCPRRWWVLFLIWFALLHTASKKWLTVTGPTQLRGVNKTYNEKIAAAWDDIFAS